MSWPTASARTKDWSSEVLTDADLESQFDILHTYFNDMLDGTTGHGHSGGDGDGAKIDLTIGVQGVLPEANGGTGLSSGFLNGNPIGSIITWPTVSAPTDYLLCDGTAVSRTTYADLFSVLSTAYGIGDGSTTFNLPNLKGKVPVGYDATQTEFDAMGETGGEKTHTLITSEIPAHTHTETVNDSVGGANTIPTYVTQSGIIDSSVQTGSTGGDGAHNNLQPYITLN
jgi:microcystin-dependent protein